MTKSDSRPGENPRAFDRRRPSVMSIMSIAAVLNDADDETEQMLPPNDHQARPTASHTDRLSIRSRTHHPHQELPADSTSTLSRPRANSSSTQSSEAVASSPRRPSRAKYSEEEIAFIWFHRVDLRREWDTIVRAFNLRFRHSHLRRKSGLECKLYRVLDTHSVPQIREWRKRSKGGVQDAIPYYGIVEWTDIRYPWMGAQHWPPRPLR
jgi:hypothetical protein